MCFLGRDADDFESSTPDEEVEDCPFSSSEILSIKGVLVLPICSRQSSSSSRINIAPGVTRREKQAEEDSSSSDFKDGIHLLFLRRIFCLCDVVEPSIGRLREQCPLSLLSPSRDINEDELSPRGSPYEELPIFLDKKGNNENLSLPIDDLFDF